MPEKRLPDYTLRPAIAADSDFVYDVKKGAFHDYVVQVWGKWDETWQRQYHDEHFVPDRTRIIVVEKRDVGYVMVKAAEDCTYLVSIYLQAEYQNRGIGSSVIRSVLHEGGLRGLPVRLRVLKINPASALYRRLGFNVVDETETHYIMEHC